MACTAFSGISEKATEAMDEIVCLVYARPYD
jgi:hypothetical protein